MTHPTAHPRLARYAWGVLIANLAVVLWGAVVRATGSGAGCGRHWPACNGVVLPELGSHKTLIEFTHRATSGIAFILVLVLLIATLRTTRRGHPARGGAIAAMTFMVMEALAGAGLVWFELVADDRSAARAQALAVHLVITFLLLAGIALTAAWLGGQPRAVVRWRSRRTLQAALCAALLLVIGISGAMTALGDTLFPKTSVGLDSGEAQHFLERLRAVHPFLAILGGALVVYLARRLAAGAGSARSASLARACGMVFVTQLAVGTLNLVLLVPLWTQLLHLALADCLWISFVLTAASVLAAPAASAVVPHAEPVTV